MDPNHTRRFEELTVRVVPHPDGGIAKLVMQDDSTLLDFADVTFIATANTVAPVVTPAEATTGTVMSSTTGTWTHNPYTYTYQWKADDVAINGATASTYTVLEADLTKEITCAVSAVNRAGAATPVASNGVTPTAPE